MKLPSGWLFVTKVVNRTTVEIEEKELILCKDCKHFEYDSWANVGGIPLIVAHEICKRWGDGCKTSENGYCFMADKKGSEEEHGL